MSSRVDIQATPPCQPLIRTPTCGVDCTFGGRDWCTLYAPVAIKDSPFFEHRDLNLNISRNCLSPNGAKRSLDAIGFSKLKRLHLPTSDSESWTFEISALPELAMNGAYHKSQIWSVEDFKEVWVHDTSRGVRVYIEADMTRYPASIFHAYPGPIAAYNKQRWELYAVERPSRQLKLNSDEVRHFITTLFNDFLPRVSGYSSYFHVGGDKISITV